MKISLKSVVRPRSGFSGGIYLPRPNERGFTKTVQSLPTPAMLYVLMQQHDGPPATVCVEPDEVVQSGQCIGRAEQPGSMNVHSPVAGRILATTHADSARRTDVLAVQIKPALDQVELPGPSPAEPRIRGQAGLPDVASPSLDALIVAAEQAGLTDFQPHAHSLADILRDAGRRGVRHVIVNMLPGEPIPHVAAVNLDHDAATLTRASQWVGQALNARRIWLAIDRENRRTLTHMRTATRKTPVRIADLANKYPQHSPVLLAATITGRNTPPGCTTLDVGVLVLEWEALLGLSAAIEFDGYPASPMTHRIVSISGPAVAQPGCYRIPLGTPFEHILKSVGLRTTVRRVVEGGPMTGHAISHLDVVTTKQTSAILVLDRTSEHVPTPGPCIRCGWCQEDCPVGIDPQAILDMAERNEWSAVQQLHPRACVECGLCSYVCPAELPLYDNVMLAKAYRQA